MVNGASQMKLSPIAALMHQASTRPKSTPFSFNEQVWTYEWLAAEAQRLARGLASRSVGPGDRVVLHMMNRPEMIVAFYACFFLRAIAVPLRTTLKFAELVPLLRRLKPALYIGGIDLYDNIAPVDVSILPWNKRFVVNGTFEDCGVRPWEVLFEGGTNESLPTAPDWYQPAVLISTSGTTGLPKFVIHTPATLSESVDLILRHRGLSEADIMVEPRSMAHMSGFVGFLAYIQFGIPFVLLESFDADKVLDTIDRHQCTWYFGAPAQYATLLERQLIRPRNLTSLRICLTGADACPVDLQEQVTSIFGVPLYNLWAATEVVGSLTFGLQHGPVVRTIEEAQSRL
jgi:long-chain acyl-CoA synthetase